MRNRRKATLRSFFISDDADTPKALNQPGNGTLNDDGRLAFFVILEGGRLNQNCEPLHAEAKRKGGVKKGKRDRFFG